jgi:hypothetical protein
MKAFEYLAKIIILIFTIYAVVAFSAPSDDETVKELIRNTERLRLKSLVDADMVTARKLHADDFELITPSGGVMSKEKYMTDIESGRLDYKIWNPGDITVRLYGNVALIRYTDTGFEVFQNGKLAWSGIVKHTDLYEKIDGQWKVVWSHASGGKGAN